jgi:hypothetical protein
MAMLVIAVGGAIGLCCGRVLHHIRYTPALQK